MKKGTCKRAISVLFLCTPLLFLDFLPKKIVFGDVYLSKEETESPVEVTNDETVTAVSETTELDYSEKTEAISTEPLSESTIFGESISTSAAEVQTTTDDTLKLQDSIDHTDPLKEETVAQITVKEAPKVELRFAYSQTTEDFIQRIGLTAQKISNENDLYASVMIAQAILESASGNSALAASPNYNLFGIKGSYQDEAVRFPTQEDNGEGQLSTIQAEFRKYPDYEASLQDYASLLTNDFYSGARKSVATSYENATSFLTGRYATDTSYDAKLNALIKTYELTKYDNQPEVTVEEKEVVEEENTTYFSGREVVDVQTQLGTIFPNEAYEIKQSKNKKSSKANGIHEKAENILGNQRVN